MTAILMINALCSQTDNYIIRMTKFRCTSTRSCLCVSSVTLFLSAWETTDFKQFPDGICKSRSYSVGCHEFVSSLRILCALPTAS